MVAMARGVTVLLCSFPVAAAMGCSPYGQACNGECSASSSVVSDSSAVTDSDGDTAASDGDTAATDGDTDGYSGWLGAPCMSEEDEQAEAGKPLVHFDIDAGRVDGKDFFRLPFPNDIRRTASGIDLTGFPTPPPEFTADFGDFIDAWIDGLEHDTSGFAVNTAVVFRSTDALDLSSAGAGIRIINIDPSHPDYGKATLSLSLRSEGGLPSRNNYLCQNWLGVEPGAGQTLAPGAVYAYVLEDTIRTLEGEAVAADDDFKAMLSATAPSGGALKAAWDRYAPLRAYLASAENKSGSQLSADHLLAAAVVTTADDTAILSGAREALLGAARPEFVEFFPCDGGGVSPCASAPGLTQEEQAERACGPSGGGFVELHGRARLPIFQQGAAPYAKSGGAIELSGGAPVQVGAEEVCFALTIPEGEAPEAGWPVAIYGHGTGGSFRDAIPMAATAAARGFATFTLEGVMHGARRRDTVDGAVDGLVEELGTNELVFNVFNPPSARDTMVQAAIDQLAAVRLIHDFDPESLPEELVPKFSFDAANTVYVGHSQGGQAGVMMLAHEPEVATAALSGVGSTLIYTLLEKREPQVRVPGLDDTFVIADLVRLALAERPDRELTAFHPVLMLLNTYVNRADADVHLRRLVRAPVEGAGAKNLLVYGGHVDEYTPLRTAINLMIASGVTLANQSIVPPPCGNYEGGENVACVMIDLGFLPRAGLPMTGNIAGGSRTAAALLLKANAGEDGHFVAERPEERARIFDFLASGLDGATPTLDAG
ncbi:MAG: hypothetical protein R3A51_03135 [Nannocystaceae bacterium]